MKVIAECLKGTREKYERAPGGVGLTLNRMLKHKWIANYGYIPDTLQADGDELDCYILGKKLIRGETYEALPICMVYNLDNGELDHKIICATSTAKHIKRDVKRIIRFIERYKKGSLVCYYTWADIEIRYEIARCKAFYKLFKLDLVKF